MKLNYFTLVLDLCYPYTDETKGWCSQLLSESAYMTEYILRAMNSEFSFDCKRINLTCTTTPLRSGIRKFGSVHEVDIPFDLAYFQMTPEEKEQYLYQVLTVGIGLLCKEKQWDYAPFEKHLLALREGNFHVEFYLPKRQCRNGKLMAKVFGVQTMQSATFYIDFFEGRKMILRKPFMVTQTESMLYNFRIAQVEWADERTVVIYDYPKSVRKEVVLDREE